MEKLTIAEGTVDDLLGNGTVPIRFEVTSRFEVVGDDPATAQLVERQVKRPWIKDYDGELGNVPASWAHRWDLSNWGFLSANVEEKRVGGAVVAWNTPGVVMLVGRGDLAVLWDLRVHPDFRGCGVGTALFKAAVEWAGARGCCEMHVETQNINVPACRFYQRMGCRLIQIDRHAYPEYPGEIQLMWALPINK